MRIQPADRIIISAVITSSSPTVHITWAHGNVTYLPAKENPFCSHAKDQVSIKELFCSVCFFIYYLLFLGMCRPKTACHHFQSC